MYAGLETIQEYACCAGTDACGETAPPCECGVTATGCGDGWPLAREFVWGDANRFPEPIVMMDFTGAGMPNTWDPEAPVPTPPIFYYYLHDALGSVVALTDNVGRLVERYTYDPYGRVVVEQPDDPDGPADANPCETGCAPVQWKANICGEDEVLTANSLTYSAYGNPFMWTGQRLDAVTGTYHFYGRTYLPQSGRWAQRDPFEYVDGISLYEYVRSNPLSFFDALGFKTCVLVLGNPGGGSDELAKELASDSDGKLVLNGGWKDVRNMFGDPECTEIIIISHGTGLGSRKNNRWCKKKFPGWFSWWTKLDDADPALTAPEKGEWITPTELKTYPKNENLKKVELYACFQGYGCRAKQWQDACGEGVQVTTHAGECKPWLRFIKEWFK